MTVKLLFASLLSALCMVIPYWNGDLFFFSWFGLVSWLITITTTSSGNAYLSGLILGLLLFSGSGYWMLDFLQSLNGSTGISFFLALTYWFYCAQIPALIGLFFSLALRYSPAFAWLTPCVYGSVLLIVTPTIFPVNFAVTQTQWPFVLQPIRITGEIGLHACILLANGLLVEIWRNKKCSGWPLVGGGSFLCCWLLMSYWLWFQPETPQATIKIGVVQPNYPASSKIPAPEPGFTRAYSPELEISQRLAHQQAELIIWPETRFTGYHAEETVRQAIHNLLKNYPTRLLIQDLQQYNSNTDFNLSMAISAQGIEGRYYKQQRIAFGEYLPMADWPWAGKFLQAFFKDIYTPIGTAPSHGKFIAGNISYQPFICYEAIAGFYINSYLALQEKRPQFLVFQSNNAWFGNSIQPQLHIASSTLRAVEQGLPVVHAMNNGPSTVISARGQRLFTSEPNVRQGYLFELRYAQEPSPAYFNRYPYAFTGLLIILALLHLLLLLRKSIIRKHH